MIKKTISDMDDVFRLVEEIRQRQIARKRLEGTSPVDQCGGAPDAAPTATKLPQDMNGEELKAAGRRAAE